MASCEQFTAVKIFLETLHKIGKEKAKETANLNISLS
jgi:hypothetical protein